MRTRVIILGWHFINELSFKIGKETFNWCSGYIKEINNINFIIGGLDINPIVFNKDEREYKIYLFAHPKGKFDDNCKINEQIGNVIKKEKEKDNEILIYLHESPWDANVDFKDYQGPNISKTVLHIKSGGGAPIYGDSGILNSSKNAFMSEEMTNLRWDDVWEIFYVGLEQKKNELINNWLPLAIDIQGLSEVRNDIETANHYLEAVREGLRKENEGKKIGENTFSSLLKKHDDIINDFDKLKNIIPDRDKLVCFLENLDNDKKKVKDLREIYLNPHNKNIFFLPEWLRNIVNKFDNIKSI